MFWSKKDNKRVLPDLPPYRGPGFRLEQTDRRDVGGNDDFDDEVPQKHELPSFPDSLNEKGFSQAAIKDAVGNSYEDSNKAGGANMLSGSPVNKPFKTVEMEEWTPSIDKRDQGMLRPSLSEVGTGLKEPEIEDRREPIKGPRTNDLFVKLDKFYSARKALIEAQQKMEDIDQLLNKIRETKMREEQEINSWEKELLTVKSKMNDITVNLFEKVD